jgi:hypothetical protein
MIDEDDRIIIINSNGRVDYIDNIVFCVINKNNWHYNNNIDESQIKMTFNPNNPSDLKTMVEIQEKIKSLELLKR